MPYASVKNVSLAARGRWRAEPLGPAASRVRQEVTRDLVASVAPAALTWELVETVRRNVTIDWTFRENGGAQLRVLVKRILRKHGYPPDKLASQTVLEQAALLSAEWAVA